MFTRNTAKISKVGRGSPQFQALWAYSWLLRVSSLLLCLPWSHHFIFRPQAHDLNLKHHTRHSRLKMSTFPLLTISGHMDHVYSHICQFTIIRIITLCVFPMHTAFSFWLVHLPTLGEFNIPTKNRKPSSGGQEPLLNLLQLPPWWERLS